MSALETLEKREIMGTATFKNAAETILRVGQIPLPVNETLLELLETIMTEEQARFIAIFEKPLNHEELKTKADLNPSSTNFRENEAKTRQIFF